MRKKRKKKGQGIIHLHFPPLDHDMRGVLPRVFNRTVIRKAFHDFHAHYTGRWYLEPSIAATEKKKTHV